MGNIGIGAWMAGYKAPLRKSTENIPYRTTEYEFPDFLSETGARLLAERIRAFWSENGFTVRVHVEHVMMNRSTRRDHDRAVYVVRSNLVAGMPPGLTAAKEGA